VEGGKRVIPTIYNNQFIKRKKKRGGGSTKHVEPGKRMLRRLP